jgi:transcriptional regulator with XRE-family HTH domain
MVTFSVILKELRDERGLTQEELAIATHLTKTSISRYENGKRLDPGRSELIKLANFFNVSLDYLVGESEIKESLSIKEVEKAFSGLDDDNKLKAISYVNYLMKEQEENANKKK